MAPTWPQITAWVNNLRFNNGPWSPTLSACNHISVDGAAPDRMGRVTSMSYFICKSKISSVFGMVAQQTDSISLPSYEEVMKLDARLQEAYESIPPFLLTRPLGQSLTDPAEVIIQRFNIILFFHKTRCVLHRKYLTAKESQTRYPYSIDSCTDSAMEILHFQSSIFDAVQPGGPLCRDRWYLNSLSMHDFLLAAMIIYLRLTRENQSVALENMQFNHMYRALEKSHTLFTNAGTEFFAATKAAKILTTMLTHVYRQRDSGINYGRVWLGAISETSILRGAKQPIIYTASYPCNYPKKTGDLS
jgi:hypothetical protein